MKTTRIGRNDAKRLAADEHGFSLVELLVVMATLMIVLGATLLPLESGARVTGRDVGWGQAIQDEQAGLARMVRELRQTYSVVATTPNSIDFLVTLAGQQRQVFYECDVQQSGTAYRQCVRLEAAPGAALPALASGQTVIPRVLNGTLADPVFGFSPNGIAPNYVTAKVESPASGEQASGGLGHQIVLSDGAYLRNLAL